jgi:modification methylase
VCLDPFSGSGTTCAVAVRWGRRAIGFDVRQSQVDAGLKRIANETPLGLFTEAGS